MLLSLTSFVGCLCGCLECWTSFTWCVYEVRFHRVHVYLTNIVHKTCPDTNRTKYNLGLTYLQYSQVSNHHVWWCILRIIPVNSSSLLLSPHKQKPNGLPYKGHRTCDVFYRCPTIPIGCYLDYAPFCCDTFSTPFCVWGLFVGSCIEEKRKKKDFG